MHKKITIVVLFIYSLSFSQITQLQVPDNAMFYMEVNGKKLNEKVNWQKFNQFKFIKDLYAKKDKSLNWNDFSLTGIEYNATQYHYTTKNDSITSYVAVMPINSIELFSKFINSRKTEGLEITKKPKYDFISLEENVFVAWNGKYAVINAVSYSKPYKYDYAMVDSISVAVDSTAVVGDVVEMSAEDAVDAAAAAVEEAEEEKPFDYKEEVKYLKEEISYLKSSIKDNQEQINEYNEKIKYLQKHKKYPPVKEEDPELIEEAEEEDGTIAEEEYDYQKEMDSINHQNFAIQKNMAEKLFDSYYNTPEKIVVPSQSRNFKSNDSDVFIWTNFGSVFNKGYNDNLYRRTNILGNYWGNMMKFYSQAYDSQTTYNIYFDKEKIRVVNNYRHNNPEIQKELANIYTSSRSKKLTKYINKDNFGFYSINIESKKYFDFFYSFFKNTFSEGKNDYSKEVDMLVETMKIVLDEEAISKIATGNGVFVLNGLGNKKVDYVTYEYDEEYNSKEVKKTKDVVVPDFTFAFATENESFWTKLFNMMANNKEIKGKILKNAEGFTINMKKDDMIEKLHVKLSDGVVVFSTNASFLNGTEDNLPSDDKKLLRDYALAGKVNMQKVLVGIEKEFDSKKSEKDLDYYTLLKNHIGNVLFYTTIENNSVQTKLDYIIKDNNENSFMYFFNMIEDFFNISHKEEVKPSL